jgi:hypothetical protein
MADRWSGLYLRARKSDVESTFLRIASNRGYRILNRINEIDYPLFLNIETNGIGKPKIGDNVDIVFFVPVNNSWVRVIGFEQVDTVHPRLIFNSELVIALCCDAFECGFLEDVSWWYIYYENGMVIDRFDSNPIETITQPHYDQPLDPSDPRTIYYLCNGIKEWQYVDIPDEVISQFVGKPEKLESILDRGNVESLKNIMNVESPEEAISQFGAISTLQYINEYLALGLLSVLTNTLVEPEKEVSELLQRGISLAILEHPKNVYGDIQEK